MANDKPKEEVVKAEPETIVVEVLPQQPIRRATLEDGKEYIMLTRDEAMTEMLSLLRKIDKKL